MNEENKEKQIERIEPRFREMVKESISHDYFCYRQPYYSDSVLLYGIRREESPTLSIVIPTFHREDMLERCLKSVCRQIGSIDVEVVVVDNEPEHILESPLISIFEKINDNRLLYFCNKKNIGSGGNWNNCVYLASGRWVSILNDDDILHKDWIKQMEFLIEKCGEEKDVICCELFYLRSEDDLTRYTGRSISLVKEYRDVGKEIKKGLSAPILGACFKRDFFYKIGGFDIQADQLGDYAFISNAVLFGKVVKVNTPLYGYWTAGDNISKSKGLWEAMTVCSYYFRKQLLKKMNENGFVRWFYPVFKLSREIINCNLKWLKLQDFETNKVDTELVLSICNIPIIKFLMIYPVAFAHSIKCSIKKNIIDREKRK